ncbi:hydroxymethylglutaryl-CoA reductase [Candidatus Gottesmanbacteria bacterium]|nr:hydroxymethylglutaryl-CoA reductase [Candidatus Gottesmanbacteria bacterium]
MIRLREFKTSKKRREALEKELGVSLSNIGHYSLDEETASTRNCENMTGVVQLPLGIAGPLKLKTQNSKLKTYYVPLGTTEGALVASVNRGCKAITEAGGANVFMEKIGITRGPVFKTNSLTESFALAEWLKSHFNDISKASLQVNHCSKQTSGHIELKKIESQVLGKNVFVRFYFDTQEAMGMNMATIAVDKMVPFIEEKTGSRCLSLTGNFCVDKKASWLNFLLGRGRKVWAEAKIPERIVKEVLKTTPQKIYEVWLSKCLLGSAMAGSMGFNAHFANIIAAIFCATGQDLAHVVEGSLGITTVENLLHDLYVSVYLPDLIIGTVGGGTGLPTQKQALSILGIKNGQKSGTNKLAEIIGGAVLAGEVSLLASLAEGSLAKAHERLGRGR